ncbi:two-component sensor histidine kinase (plasmid) [Fischerella sp. NIES-4106]|nr:two-component sensor histidine kinase [Fischerella sp. NIES-4106]
MNKTRSEFKYYLVAVISVAIALILTLTIENLVERSLIGPFLAAVAITAWYSGLKPGIVAVILSTIACDYYIFSPVDSIATMTPASLVRNTQLVLVASLICYLTGRLRSTTQRLTDTNKALEAEIREHIQTEAALTASEAELRALFSAIPDPLFVIDAEGRILRAALIESEKLYKPINEQVNRTLHEIFERPQADTYLSYVRQALQTQQPVAVEYSLMLGEQKTWFAARIAPISEDIVIWLARDISERKRAEEVSIIEERNRMAREIHDTLAQAFTGIIIHSRSASGKLTTDTEKAQTHLSQAQELAFSGLTEARRSVEALRRPYLLENGHLYDALAHLVTQMRLSAQTCIVCEARGTAYPLPADVENNLLRIGQEALTNAIKYADASEIRIELIYEPTQCFLRVKDDGQGFIFDSSFTSKGFGLMGMTERANRIGAQLKIQSAMEEGTEIVVSAQRRSL